MFVANYVLQTTQETTREVLEVLRSIENPVQFYKGCRFAQTWQNLDDPEKFMVMEVWNSRNELEQYMRSPLFRRMLAVFEMCAEKPQVRYVECDKVSGLEMIEEVLLPKIKKITA